MRVAQKFAGYSLAEADNLRKAMRQEDPRADRQGARRSSSTACERTGYGAPLGTQLFDIIEPFADYAFNKSHAYGYGLIAYQTAYLKAHYPVEYFACLLTSVKGNLDKAAVYLAECRAMGIRVLNPDINRSVSDFAALSPAEVPDDVVLPAASPGAILFGLSAVRNVGEGLVELLLDRAGGQRALRRLPRLRRARARAGAQQAHRRVADQGRGLRRAGPPAPGPARRSSSTSSTTTLGRRRERDQGVMSLFGDVEESAGDGASTSASPSPTGVRQERALLRFEKEMLGLYVSATTRCSARRRRCAARSTSRSAISTSCADGAAVRVGGVVTGLARKFTKRGDPMAVVRPRGPRGRHRGGAVPRTLAEHGHKLADDAIVVVSGRINKRDETASASSCEDIEVLTGLEDGPAPTLTLRVPEVRLVRRAAIQHLERSARDHAGASPVVLDLGSGKVLRLTDEYRVDVDRVVPEIRMAFGHDAVRPADPAAVRPHRLTLRRDRGGLRPDGARRSRGWRSS